MVQRQAANELAATMSWAAKVKLLLFSAFVEWKVLLMDAAHARHLKCAFGLASGRGTQESLRETFTSWRHVVPSSFCAPPWSCHGSNSGEPPKITVPSATASMPSLPLREAVYSPPGFSHSLLDSTSSTLLGPPPSCLSRSSCQMSPSSVQSSMRWPRGARDLAVEPASVSETPLRSSPFGSLRQERSRERIPLRGQLGGSASENRLSLPYARSAGSEAHGPSGKWEVTMSRPSSPTLCVEVKLQ